MTGALALLLSAGLLAAAGAAGYALARHGLAAARRARDASQPRDIRARAGVIAALYAGAIAAAASAGVLGAALLLYRAGP